MFDKYRIAFTIDPSTQMMALARAIASVNGQDVRIEVESDSPLRDGNVIFIDQTEIRELEDNQ